MKISYLEIYNEKIFDLLRDNFEEQQKLYIFENKEDNDFTVGNSIVSTAENLDEALELFRKGE